MLYEIHTRTQTQFELHFAFAREGPNDETLFEKWSSAVGLNVPFLSTMLRDVTERLPPLSR